MKLLFFISSLVFFSISSQAQDAYTLAYRGADGEVFYAGVNEQNGVVEGQFKADNAPIFKIIATSDPVQNGAYELGTYKIKAPNGKFLDENFRAVASESTAAEFNTEIDWSFGNGAGELMEGTSAQISLEGNKASQYYKNSFFYLEENNSINLIWMQVH